MDGKRLIVLSSPSGGGKSTLAHHLLANYSSVDFSVSCTTRPMRNGEKEGEDYYFLSRKSFLEKMAADEFAEHEEIFGNLYGTLKSEINKVFQSGHYVLFDVDVKGALSLRNAYPDNSILVFIMPPTLEELERRLRRRDTETEEQIEKRLARAKDEIELQGHFDHLLINDDLETAKKEIIAIAQKYIS